MNQDVWMCRCGWGHGRSAAFCSKCRDPSPWLRAKGAKRQPAVEDLQAEIAALKAQLAQAREALARISAGTFDTAEDAEDIASAALATQPESPARQCDRCGGTGRAIKFHSRTRENPYGEEISCPKCESPEGEKP